MYLTEENRMLLETTLYNICSALGRVLNEALFRENVANLTDKELEQEINKAASAM